jgi:hypothetical protein
MLKRFTRETHRILLSGIPCMDVRGFTEPELIEARRRSTMDKWHRRPPKATRCSCFREWSVGSRLKRRCWTRPLAQIKRGYVASEPPRPLASSRPHTTE